MGFDLFQQVRFALDPEVKTPGARHACLPETSFMGARADRAANRTRRPLLALLVAVPRVDKSCRLATVMATWLNAKEVAVKSYIFDAGIQQEADGRWSAWMEALPGCAAWGYTKQEALEALEDAAELYVQDDRPIIFL